jgi:hypothetical protein
MIKFMALQGAPYIYDISRLRVKIDGTNERYRMFVLSENFYAVKYSLGFKLSLTVQVNEPTNFMEQGPL